MYWRAAPCGWIKGGATNKGKVGFPTAVWKSCNRHCHACMACGCKFSADGTCIQTVLSAMPGLAKAWQDGLRTGKT